MTFLRLYFLIYKWEAQYMHLGGGELSVIYEGYPETTQP